MQGTEGLTHTEAQAEWLQGNALFIPSGSWLENEMRELTPEGFDMVVIDSLASCSLGEGTRPTSRDPTCREARAWLKATKGTSSPGRRPAHRLMRIRDEGKHERGRLALRRPDR